MVSICLHFGWFFLISSNFSPYLGKPSTGYGVYPYFFIFWTFIDFMIVGLIYFLQDENQSNEPFSAKPDIPKIKLTRGKETIYCSPHDIQWLSSDNYYTHLQTIHGKFIMRNPLKVYYELLQPHGFLQIHRSTVVNLQDIDRLTKSERKLFVVMKDGTRQVVSRKNVPIVKEYFNSQAKE